MLLPLKRRDSAPTDSLQALPSRNWSEREPDADLSCAALGCACNLTEIRRKDIDIGIPVVRVVERIERFGADMQTQGFLDVDSLRKPYVHHQAPWTAHLRGVLGAGPNCRIGRRIRWNAGERGWVQVDQSVLPIRQDRIAADVIRPAVGYSR